MFWTFFSVFSGVLVAVSFGIMVSFSYGDDTVIPSGGVGVRGGKAAVCMNEFQLKNKIERNECTLLPCGGCNL